MTQQFSLLPLDLPVADEMFPLKFIEASGVNGVQMEDEMLSSPACQKCLLAFQENVRLVLALVAAPGFSVLIMFQSEEASARAGREVFQGRWTGEESLKSANQSELGRFFHSGEYTHGEHRSIRQSTSAAKLGKGDNNA